MDENEVMKRSYVTGATIISAVAILFPFAVPVGMVIVGRWLSKVIKEEKGIYDGVNYCVASVEAGERLVKEKPTMGFVYTERAQ